MKWELKREPEMVPVEIDPMLYKVQLDELANILYKAFCQLDPKSKLSQFPTTQYSSIGNDNKKRVI